MNLDSGQRHCEGTWCGVVMGTRLENTWLLTWALPEMQHLERPFSLDFIQDLQKRTSFSSPYLTPPRNRWCEGCHRKPTTIKETLNLVLSTVWEATEAKLQTEPKPGFEGSKRPGSSAGLKVQSRRRCVVLARTLAFWRTGLLSGIGPVVIDTVKLHSVKWFEEQGLKMYSLVAIRENVLGAQLTSNVQNSRSVEMYRSSCKNDNI